MGLGINIISHMKNALEQVEGHRSPEQKIASNIVLSALVSPNTPQLWEDSLNSGSLIIRIPQQSKVGGGAIEYLTLGYRGVLPVNHSLTDYLGSVVGELNPNTTAVGLEAEYETPVNLLLTRVIGEESGRIGNNEGATRQELAGILSSLTNNSRLNNPLLEEHRRNKHLYPMVVAVVDPAHYYLLGSQLISQLKQLGLYILDSDHLQLGDDSNPSAELSREIDTIAEELVRRSKK